MTEREACEQIVAQENCAEVECSDCPLFEGAWDCDCMDEVTLAEMWLRLHPTEKKLVFSAEKFYADESILECLRETSKALGWPEKYDGKTEEELYFPAFPEWMEER